LLHNDIKEPALPPLPVIVSDVKFTGPCIKNCPPPPLAALLVTEII
jgi:hypothetical protein